uniref:Uncharacterized protein n=1 Tax=Anguilla anguilla TaxID=7936 RepID=A0A0E9WMM8_ANGAN
MVQTGGARGLNNPPLETWFSVLCLSVIPKVLDRGQPCKRHHYCNNIIHNFIIAE